MVVKGREFQMMHMKEVLALSHSHATGGQRAFIHTMMHHIRQSQKDLADFLPRIVSSVFSDNLVFILTFLRDEECPFSWSL